MEVHAIVVAAGELWSFRGVATTGRGGGPNLANVSVVGRVSVKFPCYMLLTGRRGGGPATQNPL